MGLTTLAERAHQARKRAGFKNEQAAADAIGCSRPLVISWERGPAKSIGTEHLFAAARAYDVDPAWLAMQADHDGYPFSVSQSVRIDIPTLRRAAQLLIRVCPQFGNGEPFDPVNDADLLVRLYREVILSGGELSADNVVQLGEWIASKRRTSQQEGIDEQQSNQGTRRTRGRAAGKSGA